MRQLYHFFDTMSNTNHRKTGKSYFKLLPELYLFYPRSARIFFENEKHPKEITATAQAITMINGKKYSFHERSSAIAPLADFVQ